MGVFCFFLRSACTVHATKKITQLMIKTPKTVAPSVITIRTKFVFVSRSISATGLTLLTEVALISVGAVLDLAVAVGTGGGEGVVGAFLAVEVVMGGFVANVVLMAEVVWIVVWIVVVVVLALMVEINVVVVFSTFAAVVVVSAAVISRDVVLTAVVEIFVVGIVVVVSFVAAVVAVVVVVVAVVAVVIVVVMVVVVEVVVVVKTLHGQTRSREQHRRAHRGANNLASTGGEP